MSTHSLMKNAAYTLGSRMCLAQLDLLKLANYEGFPPPESQDQGQNPEASSPEAMAAMQMQQGSPADQLEAMDHDAPNSMPDASTFVDFAQTDDTEQATSTENLPEDGLQGRQPNWSGKSSLEAGDSGMRNHEMGIPRSGGV